MINKHHLIISVVILLINLNSLKSQIPSNYQNIKKPINYQTLTNYLTSIEKTGFIELTDAGKSVEGRSLHLVHLFHNNQQKKWKLFFYAHQHGNEPAGKDALIYLIKKINEEPDYLPDYVDLWIMPMVNPDGAEQNQRRNANDMDLNRDHRLLSQPETQALHQTAQKILPHVAIDCHEFTRDSKDYSEKGWQEWPLIMMDCANNPLFPMDLYRAGVEWVHSIQPVMDQQNINYTRYYVGNLPPDGELRHSTLEIDDARNGIGTYGGLSFIIESGVYRNVEDPNADLADRIRAYLTIFDQFIHCSDRYQDDIRIVSKARKSVIGKFIPTNYFWGTAPGQVNNVNVIDANSGLVLGIETANFMGQRIVKSSIKTPDGYIIPHEYADIFSVLLNRHTIEYRVISNPETFTIQKTKLIRIEPDFDNIYNRYADRIITEIQAPERRRTYTGDLFIPINQQFPWKVALVLETSMMYSIFSEKLFRESIDNQGFFPVNRVLLINE